MKSKLIILILFLVLATGCASAATYTVGYSGNAGDYNTDGTDDHVQIQAALTAAMAAGADTVYLKGPHTYNFNYQFQVPAQTTITADTGVVLRLVDNANWASTDMNMFNAKGNDSITFSGFTIDGNSGNQTKTLGTGYHEMLHFYECDNININHMNFRWGSDDAIYMQRCVGYSITNNTIYKMGHEGIYHNYCSNGMIAYNDILARTNCCIRLSNGAVNVTIRNNNLYSLVTGSVGGLGGTTGELIQISKDNAATTYAFDKINIYENKLYDCYGTGIWMYALYNSNNLSLARNVNIHHNTFTKVGQYGADTYNSFGIVIENFNNTTIQNNVFDWPGAAAVAWYVWPGDRLIPGQITTTVRNNVIQNAEPFGTVTGSGAGIVNYNTSKALFVIENNCFYNNTGNYTYPATGTWRTFSNNLNVNPLFYNDTNADSSLRDYHPKSGYGRWTGSAWYNDAGTASPLIDAGLATMSYGFEPEPNGDRINIGRYGNTAEASKSLIPGMHQKVLYQWTGSAWTPLSVAQNNTGYIGSQLQVTVS